MFDMETPKVYAYSIYSVIAEKFEAITSLGLINGRYKDFYDIYIIACNFDLSGKELQKAVVETFTHRGTDFTEIVAFESEFTNDVVRQNRWKSFVKKKKAIEDVSFEDVIAKVKELLVPIVESIEADSVYTSNWSFTDRKWI